MFAVTLEEYLREMEYTRHVTVGVFSTMEAAREGAQQYVAEYFARDGEPVKELTWEEKDEYGILKADAFGYTTSGQLAGTSLPESDLLFMVHECVLDKPFSVYDTHLL